MGVESHRSSSMPPSPARWAGTIPQSRLRRASSCCGTQNSLFAKRSQNFDHCHSFLLASSATGGARKRPPFHKGAFCHATPAALPPAKPPSGEPDRRRFNRSRQLTGDPRPAAAAALPPPKPLRGQADRRYVDRSRQPTGDPRPPFLGARRSIARPSWEKSRKGPEPLPGFRRRWRRKEAESFFVAART